MSTNHNFRVFLSAVSSEFEKTRSQVASDLRARGLEVKVQEDFRQEAVADTTLRKLHDYIAGCSAVVCIIGQRNGALPPEAAARPFAALLPAGISEASYTQWELFFARHHRKRLSIYVANPDFVPDRPPPMRLDGQELQQRLVAYLRGRLLASDPSSFPIIRNALADYRDRLKEPLWKVLDDTSQPANQDGTIRFRPARTYP